MEARESFELAVRHQQANPIPYNIEFTREARRKLVDFLNDPAFDDDLGNCFKTVDFDGFDRCREVRANVYEDWFGVQWDRSVDKDIGTVCNCLISEENTHGFKFPDHDSDILYRGTDEIIRSSRDKIILGNLGFSLFERAWTLMGMENLLIAMKTSPGFAHELFDRILEYNMGVLENACRHPLDCFRFGDDWGHQGGLIMGLPLWREYIKPRVKKMYEFVHSRRMLVLIHCCGRIGEILPDLVECGVDILNPFQPEVMDVFEVKRRFGEQLVFYGGISVQRTLPLGSVDEVRREVERLLEVVGKGGGYIAAPSHAIPSDARPENVVAVIEMLKHQ